MSLKKARSGGTTGKPPGAKGSRLGENGFRRIFESAPSPLLWVDDDGRIGLANRAAHALFGYPRGTLRGERIEVLVPRRLRELHYGLRRDGTEIPIEVSLNPFLHEGRRGKLAALFDMRPRMAIEENLANSEREMRLIMDHAPLIIAYVDRRRRYRFVNRRYADAFSLTKAQIVGKTMRAFLGDKTYGIIRPYWDRALRGELVSYELRFPLAQGTRRWVRVNLVPRDLPDGSVQGVFIIAKDIHEQKLGEAALQTLPQRILKAQEEERNRVSKDLHDGVNQLLGAIRFQMHSAVAFAKDSKHPAGLQFMKIEGLLDKAIEEVRRVSRALMPPELESLGLGPALQSLCEQFNPDNGLPVSLDASALPARLKPQTALQLFRICQEALSNTVKHARATRASVRFERLRGELVAVIEDNGRGFSPETHANLEIARQGLGLNHMRQRAADLGGRFEARSSPEEGTAIRVTVPLNRRRVPNAP